MNQSKIETLIKELGIQRQVIEKQRAILKSNPKPIIWNGTLNDLAYLIDSLKQSNYIDVKDSEICKLFIYGTRQVTKRQLQKTRNRINDYRDPDYLPSNKITNIFKQ